MKARITTEEKGAGRYARNLVSGDEIISRLTVLDLRMRVGGACLRTAGIGGVRTEERCRGMGYMRMLMNDTLQYIEAENYDTAALFGIPDFYLKFGFAVCFPRYRMSVCTKDAEEAPAGNDGHRRLKVKRQDFGCIVELYNSNNSERTGTLVRSKDAFRGFPHGSQYGRAAEGFVVRRGAGAAAYAIFDRSDREVNIAEVGYRDAGVFSFLLREFAGMAVKRRCGHINFFMPPEYAFAEYLRRFGCELTARYPKNWGGMVKIINQDSVVEKLKGELQRRYSMTGAGDGFYVSFITDIGKSSLALEGSRPRPPGKSVNLSIELPGEKLAQLLFGYRPPGDVFNDDGVKIRRGEEALPNCVFYTGSLPYMWWPDRF